MLAARISAAALLSIFALCVGAAHAAGSAPSVQLDALLVRHRAALGAFFARNALWSGAISESGTIAKYSLIADDAGRYRLSIALPLSSRSEGDDGADAWRQDENGNVQLFPSPRRESLAARLLGFNAFIEDPRFHGDLGPMTNVDGKSAYTITATFRSGPMKLYLDSRTYLLDGIDVGDRSIRYQEYRNFGGLEVPSKVVETRDASVVTTTVDALRADVAVRDPYKVPQSRQPVFADGKQDIAIDFDPVGGLIVVPCTVNGGSARFLIDSGSTSSIIDSASAKRLGLATSGTARVEGASLLTGSVARLDQLTVGGVTMKPFIMQAVPLSLPGVIARSRVDGVLGFDFLAQLVIRIAPSRGQIRFIAAPSFRYTGTGAVLAMDESDRVPRVHTTIGTKDDVTVQIDTGSDADLVLFADYADAHMRDFVDVADIGQDYARAAGGAFPIRLRQLTRLNLGDFSVPDLVTQIVVHPVGAFSPARADGIVGMGTMNRFSAVFLDYPGKRIIFER